MRGQLPNRYALARCPRQKPRSLSKTRRPNCREPYKCLLLAGPIAVIRVGFDAQKEVADLPIVTYLASADEAIGVDEARR